MGDMAEDQEERDAKQWALEYALTKYEKLKESKMTNHVKGIVEVVKNTDVITKKKDGSECKPWFSSFLKINGVVYKLGYVSQQWGPHVKAGDEVEFDFIEKIMTDDMGEQKTTREILNDFNDESKKTFKNLSAPSKGANGGFKKGGWQKDPEEQARITAMASMNSAVSHLQGTNAPETTLFALAEKIENWVFAVVQRRKFANFQSNVPNVSEGVVANKFIEDEIPF